MQSTFRYGVFAGTAGNDYSDTGIMSFEWEGVQGLTKIVEFAVWNIGALLMFSYDGIVWGPEIEVDQDDPPIQIPHAARAVQIKNLVAGVNSRYQIIGFW